MGDKLSAATNALLDLALREDLGEVGDITSRYFVDGDAVAGGVIAAREDCVIAGVQVAVAVFEKIDGTVRIELLREDGSSVGKGDAVLHIEGPARSVLTAERTALNFLQRLSGVATLTRRFVEQVEGTNARILDTRKTTPGWRELEKAAVLAGGGDNHRMGLHDMAMVKDNHLFSSGNLANLQTSIEELKADHPQARVELEADTLEQVASFLELEGVDVIMLDNMDNAQLRKAVEMRGERSVELEASGGVNLETVRAIAKTGVDCISVGALTHSSPAVDLGLDFD